MDRFVKIVVLDNDVQASILDSMLTEHGIPHLTRSYHDSAYDGLFQAARGWGCIEAPEKFKPEILNILNHLKEGKKGESEGA